MSNFNIKGNTAHLRGISNNSLPLGAIYSNTIDQNAINEDEDELLLPD